MAIVSFFISKGDLQTTKANRILIAIIKSPILENTLYIYQLNLIKSIISSLKSLTILDKDVLKHIHRSRT